ncbi:hypothetical protein OSTOST_14533 [Ostertagia ostertagi]
MMQVSVLEKAEELSPEVSSGHAVDGDVHQPAPCESSPVPSVSPSDDSPSKEKKKKKHPDMPRYADKFQYKKLTPSPSSCPKKIPEAEQAQKQPSLVQAQDSSTPCSVEM